VSDDAQMLPGFLPVEHEFAFGEEAGRPFTFGGVALRGSIDRIEAGDEGLVITDYKSARDPKGRASFGTYGLIQLPVYAAAAGALLERPILGAIYRSLRSLAARGFRSAPVDVCGHGVDKDVCSPEEIATVLAEAEGAVAEAAAGIREGAILVSPRHKSTCEWCGARAFCEEAR
jgi:ATP-dependent helicase/DNAse subunit B